MIAGAAGTLAFATSRRAVAQAAKPNVVFILADDMGYADLSCYGRPDLSTPNIDRIAANGVRFLQAYANSAVCSATRTALITGRYQYRLRLGLEEPLGATPGSPAGTSDIAIDAQKSWLRHDPGRQLAHGPSPEIWAAQERL
jgi:hypothetical protein